MRLLFALLGILLLAALGYIVRLRRQGSDYEREIRALWAVKQSNISSKLLLVEWIKQRSRGKEIAGYLTSCGIRRVGIYGMAEVGELLWEELESAGIKVAYGIDRSRTAYGKKTVRPEEVQADVDAVIVVPFYHFSEIYDVLNQRLRGSVPILGLDEIIYELGLSEREQTA